MNDYQIDLKIMLLTLCLLPTFWTFANTINTDPSKEKLTIIGNEQQVEFFINKKTGELNARLTEFKTYQSKSNLPVKVNQVISIGDNSKVKSIWKKDSRRRTEVKPIITDYESDGIFHSDLKLCITEHQINKKGGTLEVGYEKIFTDTRFLNALYFKQSYAAADSKIAIKVPSWLDLNIEEINFKSATINTVEQTEGDSKVYVFRQTGLTKFSEEKGTPSRQKTEPHLILIPQAYQLKNEKVKLTGSVDDLYSWYRQLVNQINNEPTMLRGLVKKLTQGKTTDEAKINAIYFWVQDNIRYIAFEDGINGFKPENCQSVYQNRYGDCKGMANLTKEMLKLAGYDARLTWMGTRDIPYGYDIPSLMVDNHMICTVLLNGQKLYLDATQKFTGIAEYGYYIQEQEVLIEDGDKFIRDRIPLTEKGQYATKSQQVLKLEGDRFIGQGTTSYNGSSRITLANYLSEVETAKKEKFLTYYLSNNNKNVGIANLKWSDWTLRNQPLALNYDIAIENQVIDLGKELYLNVEIDHEFEHSELEPDRTMPYEFSDKYIIDSSCEIQLPATVTVDYLPEPVAVQTEGYSFLLKYEQTGDNTILYTRRIELNQTMLEVADFPAWNAAIASVKSFYEDQIIVRK